MPLSQPSSMPSPKNSSTESVQGQAVSEALRVQTLAAICALPQSACTALLKASQDSGMSLADVPFLAAVKRGEDAQSLRAAHGLGLPLLADSMEVSAQAAASVFGPSRSRSTETQELASRMCCSVRDAVAFETSAGQRDKIEFLRGLGWDLWSVLPSQQHELEQSLRVQRPEKRSADAQQSFATAVEPRLALEERGLDDVPGLAQEHTVLQCMPLGRSVMEVLALEMSTWETLQALLQQSAVPTLEALERLGACLLEASKRRFKSAHVSPEEWTQFGEEASVLFKAMAGDFAQRHPNEKAPNLLNVDVWPRTRPSHMQLWTARWAARVHTGMGEDQAIQQALPSPLFVVDMEARTQTTKGDESSASPRLPVNALGTHKPALMTVLEGICVRKKSLDRLPMHRTGFNEHSVQEWYEKMLQDKEKAHQWIEQWRAWMPVQTLEGRLNEKGLDVRAQLLFLDGPLNTVHAETSDETLKKWMQDQFTWVSPWLQESLDQFVAGTLPIVGAESEEEEAKKEREDALSSPEAPPVASKRAPRIALAQWNSTTQPVNMWLAQFAWGVLPQSVQKGSKRARVALNGYASVNMLREVPLPHVLAAAGLVVQAIEHRAQRLATAWSTPQADAQDRDVQDFIELSRCLEHIDTLLQAQKRWDAREPESPPRFPDVQLQTQLHQVLTTLKQFENPESRTSSKRSLINEDLPQAIACLESLVLGAPALIERLNRAQLQCPEVLAWTGLKKGATLEGRDPKRISGLARRL